ncbi:MAG: hypothetical protein KGJ21_08910, partial [Pseudomonadota bacterium]|nr:hypothetical protein [Pseudomonadota bacterium]
PTALNTYVDANALILANANTAGNGGNVAVWSDGSTYFYGRIEARGGANSGNGGYVETSGKVHLHIGDQATVDTSAAGGSAGTWLLDPQDFTIAASGGDMTGATLTTNLGSGNVTILSSSGGTSGSGTIYVNDTVSWSAHTLTLTAADNVTVGAAMTVTGSGALTISAATANGSDSAVSGGALGMTFNTGAGGFAGHIDYSSGGTLTIGGHAYTVLSGLGAAGSTTGTDLQGMNGNLVGYYALGANIDASATSGWNAGAGFTPVGTSSTNFTGSFEGLGHVISGLTINRPSTNNVGLFGETGSSHIADVGLSGGTITGSIDVGGLVGVLGGSATISDSYATGAVSGSSYVGGLVGYNYGTITNNYASGAVSDTGGYIGGLVGENDGTVSGSYATGAVSVSASSKNYVGGLVGRNGGTVSNGYATGSVTTGSSSSYVGGLVGINTGTISDSYATGLVSGGSGSSFVGGLMGGNYNTVTNSFWDTQTSGQATSGGGTGETTANMQTLATFTGATWSIDGNVTGSTTTWYINAGSDYPRLRAIAADMPTTVNLGTVTITASGQAVTYGTAPSTSGVLNTTYTCSGSGSACSDISGAPTLSISGVATSTSGNYAYGVWSNDILSALGTLAFNAGYTGSFAFADGALTVNKKPATITGVTADNKIYDGNVSATLNTVLAALSGKVTGDVVGLGSGSAIGTFASANVANGISVTTSGFSISGADSGNYSLTQPTLTADIVAFPSTVQQQIAGGFPPGGANPFASDLFPLNGNADYLYEGGNYSFLQLPESSGMRIGIDPQLQHDLDLPPYI